MSRWYEPKQLKTTYASSQPYSKTINIRPAPFIITSDLMSHFMQNVTDVLERDINRLPDINVQGGVESGPKGNYFAIRVIGIAEVADPYAEWLAEQLQQKG